MNEIVYVIWTAVWLIGSITNIISNTKLAKKIDDVNQSIDELSKDDDDFQKSIDELVTASQNKSTAQDNVLWKSIIILAKEINDLKDRHYV